MVSWLLGYTRIIVLPSKLYMAMLDKWSLGQLDKGYLMINDCNIDNGLHMHTCIYVYSI
jgi:hypothetical protein